MEIYNNWKQHRFISLFKAENYAHLIHNCHVISLFIGQCIYKLGRHSFFDAFRFHLFIYVQSVNFLLNLNLYIETENTWKISVYTAAPPKYGMSRAVSAYVANPSTGRNQPLDMVWKEYYFHIETDCMVGIRRECVALLLSTMSMPLYKFIQ